MLKYFISWLFSLQLLLSNLSEQLDPDVNFLVKCLVIFTIIFEDFRKIY